MKTNNSPKPTSGSAPSLAEEFTSAIAAFRAGKLDQAEGVLQRVLQQFPDYFEALYLLGVLYGETKHYAAAFLLFDKALTLRPDNQEIRKSYRELVKRCNQIHFREAIVLHRQGCLNEADALYHAMLQRDPNHFDALRLSGAIAVQKHDYSRALDYLQRALTIRPDDPEPYSNRGVALRELKRLDDALASYDRAIALKPDLADAHYNRGVVLQELKCLEDALASYDRAIALKPDYADAYNSRGNVLRQLNRVEDALSSYERAIALKPDHAEAHSNRGNLLRESERLDDALASYDRAIALKPDIAEFYNNRGVALLGLKYLNDALASYERAIALKPDYAEAHNNRGIVLYELKCLKDALTSYDRAIALKSDYAEAYYSRGNTLWELKRLDDAIASYDRAIALKPDFADAYSTRGLVLRDLNRLDDSRASYDKAISIEPNRALFQMVRVMGSLPIIPKSESEASLAIEQFGVLLQRLDAWIADDETRRNRFSKEIGSTQPFLLAYRHGNHCRVLSEYGDLLTSNLEHHDVSRKTRRSFRKKIRLLIVSAHIQRHSVWDVVLKGVVRHLDRSQFELFMYQAAIIKADRETDWARAHADQWRDAIQIRGKDAWLASIREDAPDVIFYPEIGMDPTTVFLAAHRLAPVQVVGWGHPITSGLDTMDCFFSGELIEGPNATGHYREKLIRLPGAGCCTEPIDIRAKPLPDTISWLSDLPAPRFVIPQNPCKFDPADDELFAKIATQVGACAFLFVEMHGKRAQLAAVLERVRRAFLYHGLDPAHYVKIVPQLERARFYSLLDACDVFLDCPGFSGYTTAWQAAHRGLPIVTLEGEFMRQRLAAGLLRQVGQIDTIAADRSQYVDIAVRLGQEVRDAARFALRREALKGAASRADHRIDVVRAFETALIEQLAVRT